MAINTPQIVQMTGNDEVVNNERVRATYPNNPYGTLYMQGTGTPTSAAPTGATTLTAAQMLTGIVVLNSGATAFTLTLDTAANILSAMNGASAGIQVGDYLQFLVINGSSTTGGTITVAGGSGVSFDTNQSSTTIPIQTSKWFNLRCTNATSASAAFTMYF